MIGNVSDWLSYAGGALIKVADSAGSTVFMSLSSCMYKTETKILIAATHLTLFYFASWQSVALSNKLKYKTQRHNTTFKSTLIKYDFLKLGYLYSCSVCMRDITHFGMQKLTKTLLDIGLFI